MSVNLFIADRLVVRPANVTVTSDDPQVFAAFGCPNSTDDPFGADGVPGTGDDFCVPRPGAQWSVLDDIGTVSPVIGPTTVFQPALPPGTSSRTGQVIVKDGSEQAVALVTVTANQLVFTDSGDQETGAVPLFQPGLRDERRIRFERELIEALERLVASFAAFPRVASGGRTSARETCPRRSRAWTRTAIRSRPTTSPCAPAAPSAPSPSWPSRWTAGSPAAPRVVSSSCAPSPAAASSCRRPATPMRWRR
jgi:hypothetical protein